MRLLIAAVGKLKQGPERDLFAHYLGRAEAAGRKLHLSPLDRRSKLPESKAATAAGAQRGRSAKRFSPRCPSSHKLICLDPGGEALVERGFRQALGEVPRRRRAKGSPS